MKQITFALILFSIVSSCGNHIRNNFPEQIQKNMSISIPPNYGKKPYVLLVIIDNPPRYSNIIKESVRESYLGPVDFPKVDENVSKSQGVGVSNADGSYSGYSCIKYVFSDRFKDLGRYRYVFDLDLYGFKSPGGSSSLPAQAFMYDRLENKYYSFPGRTSYYDELIKAYMGHLENLRYK